MNLSHFLSSLLTATILVSLVTTSASEAANMDDVKNVIRNDNSKPKPVFGATPSTTYDFYPKLRFTIQALRTHTFEYLFREDTLAKDVVKIWDLHVDGLGAPFDAELDALLIALNSNQHDRLVFADMVESRLNGDRNNLNNLIGNLKAAGFQFPLFDVVDNVEHRGHILDLLAILVVKHSDYESEDGGLGSVTWYDLFYAPAHPGIYREGKIYNTIAKMIGAAQMQGDVLPIPYVVQRPPNGGVENADADAEDLRDLGQRVETEYNESKIVVFAGGPNHCCCNDSTHESWRECAGSAFKNCTMCGNYCCLAGVMWCAPGQQHGEPGSGHGH